MSDEVRMSAIETNNNMVPICEHKPDHEIKSLASLERLGTYFFLELRISILDIYCCSFSFSFCFCFDPNHKKGFTPLSSQEIKKDFHDIEHQGANAAEDTDGECSVKTEDALPSSYPVKPRKSIKPMKPPAQSQVMSLAQYYQQQGQQGQQSSYLQNNHPQYARPGYPPHDPHAYVSEVNVGVSSQAKNKTTFISYDKRVIDETLFMYQLIQSEHPELWKEEINYEALSQRVQVRIVNSNVYFLFHRISIILLY